MVKCGAEGFGRVGVVQSKYLPASLQATGYLGTVRTKLNIEPWKQYERQETGRQEKPKGNSMQLLPKKGISHY